MGSKNNHHRDHGNDDNSPSNVDAACLVGGGEPRGLHLSRDGDGCLGDKGGGSSDDDDGDAGLEGPVAADAAVDQQNGKKAKKGKKKGKKKKKKTSKPVKQSSPPRVLLSDLFPSGNYPEGEVQSYCSEARTTTAVEERHTARMQRLHGDDFLANYRKAAEVHRQTRQWVRASVRPGQSLLDIARGIEDSVRVLLGHAGLEPGDSLRAGMGFPTGLSLNHQVAHYTPTPGQRDVVLQQHDVMKVDFGVHINGWIVDSAFTLAFDHAYDGLLDAVRDATNTGIKTAGIDVRVSDVSAAIQETMESYEVEIGGKTLPVKPVRTLSAHDIKQYRIHGGKSIPFVRNSDQTKMEEGEIFAIETFGTTGRGYTRADVGIYGYGLNYEAQAQAHALVPSLPLASARRLHKVIKENFGTIVFCRRYLDRLGLDRYLAGMNSLVSHGIVDTYEPLMDIPGSYSAQFEHTLLLHETHKEVLSRGEDY